MGKKVLTYGAGLILVYLLVEHYSGAGDLFKTGGSASVSLIKALQGR